MKNTKAIDEMMAIGPETIPAPEPEPEPEPEVAPEEIPVDGVWYKIVDTQGRPVNGGHSMTWSLPTRDENGEWVPGQWTRYIPEVEACSYGYHLAARDHVWSWCSSAAGDGNSNVHVYRAEGRGAADFSSGGKVAVSQARTLYPVIETKDWMGMIADVFEYPIPLVAFCNPDLEKTLRECVAAMRARTTPTECFDGASVWYETIHNLINEGDQHSGALYDYSAYFNVLRSCLDYMMSNEGSAYIGWNYVADRGHTIHTMLQSWRTRCVYPASDGRCVHIETEKHFYALLDGEEFKPMTPLELNPSWAEASVK